MPGAHAWQAGGRQLAETRTLTPFAIYCLVFGAASILRFAF